jgi:hypothetical protein
MDTKKVDQVEEIDKRFKLLEEKVKNINLGLKLRR